MYDASFNDPYCYKGTTILKNLLGLRSQIELEKFEKFSVAQRADEPLPDGNFGYRHFRAIHRHLFQDVYRWAGRIRTVRMAKGGSLFCLPEYIDRNMRALFEHLAADNYLRDLDSEDFARLAANFLSDLNVIHPFRDGNGRVQRTFLALVSDRAGHPLNYDRMDSPTMLRAMIEGFNGNERPLSEALLHLLRV